ncbi:MAG TPA: sel1 repeat family protein, partial [Aeromonas salmonicida]|nr:sel1 repeat family protein [Aeromonas salmonicida]
MLDPPDTFRLHRQNANWITEIIMKPIVSRWLFIGVLGFASTR